MYKNYFNLNVYLCFSFVLFSASLGFSQFEYWWSSNQNYRIMDPNFQTIDFRFGSSNHLYITTSKPYFRFNREIRLNTGELGSYGSSNLQFRTNGTERMRILSNNGFVGINNTSPSHHLQIFGNTDYIVSTLPTYMNIPNEYGTSDAQPKTSINYGHTSRISLTNSVTGNGVNNGALIFQAQNNLHILNKASGSLSLAGGGVGLHFHNNRAYMGESTSNSATWAYLNLFRHNDNGLRVRVVEQGKYGILSIAGENENALLVADKALPNASDFNFKVTGGGEVYARKYITTLNPFPDYVFSDNYKLMSYQDLRNYIRTHRHLPNIPKAETVEENGMDLGELNRILVEKVEELTLYILELEDRLSEIEKEDTPTNAEEISLVERISRLEALLEEMKN